MAIRSADDEELEPEDFARAGPHRPNRPAKDAGPDPGGDNREAAGEDRDAAAGERLPPPNKGGWNDVTSHQNPRRGLKIRVKALLIHLGVNI